MFKIWYIKDYRQDKTFPKSFFASIFKQRSFFMDKKLHFQGLKNQNKKNQRSMLYVFQIMRFLFSTLNLNLNFCDKMQKNPSKVSKFFLQLQSENTNRVQKRIKFSWRARVKGEFIGRGLKSMNVNVFGFYLLILVG